MLQQLTYDPWGRQFAVHSHSGLAGYSLPSDSRGFTSHRIVKGFEVVHMGGRTYNPFIGRFMQPDPFIQAPLNMQNYNRYSYVLNNPMSYTDPSGYFFKKMHNTAKRVQRSFFKAVGPEVSNALVAVGSAFCRPAAPACAAYGTYQVQRAYGASSTGALRSAAMAGATQWVFGAEAGSMSAQQAAMRVGTMVIAASNPALGQTLMYLQGSWGQDIGGWAQNAVGQYGQYKTQQELARFAAKNGLTLQELNLILGLNSKLGLAIAGTTYNPDKQQVTGFTTRENGLLGSWGGAIGVLWDINDSLLNAQGLLDAVSISVVSSGYTGHLTGHSLGAWRVNNLVRQGFIQSGTLYSLPGFAYPASGTSGACISTDPVCGGGLLNPLRVGTMHFTKPNSIWASHNFDEYVRQWQQRKH
ncbi:RHS repeat-associated core domain-containing protein [Alkalimonas sp. MEB108]|uniref:RHS repeat-associated core domain-containing protein n=1 Tax=Alkalimonas cellulosilytica TaxID=3058395 RepID=A0ABU7J0G9_9GAMM|nr:RHS repeat-associated core domain-containing protein [Alkalimonas sp. MEB108]MEE1999822.1 RHS repeat-associated core domain-containing protein [Alkalimonas sp. MEB108]